MADVLQERNCKLKIGVHHLEYERVQRRMQSDTSAEKINQEIQTRLYVRSKNPHLPISKDNQIKVLTNHTTQTEIRADPFCENYTIVTLLEYIPEQEINQSCLRAFSLPRVTALHWLQSPIVVEFSRKDTVGNISKLSLDTVNTNKGVLKKPAESIISDLNLLQSYFHHHSMEESMADNEVQTDISVRPHVLNEDEIARVAEAVSLQTSFTFEPDVSISRIQPELIRELDHFHDYLKTVIPSIYKEQEVVPQIEEEIKAVDESPVSVAEEQSAKVQVEQQSVNVPVEEQSAKVKIEEESAKVKIEEESAKVKIEEESAKVKIEEESVKVKIEEESAKVKIEEESAKVKIEEDSVGTEQQSVNVEIDQKQPQFINKQPCLCSTNREPKISPIQSFASEAAKSHQTSASAGKPSIITDVTEDQLVVENYSDQEKVSQQKPSIHDQNVKDYESEYSANNPDKASQQHSVSTKQGPEGSNVGDTDSKKPTSIAKGDNEYESQYSANNLENKSQQHSVSTKQGAEGSNIGDTDSKKQPSIAKGDHEYESQYSANNLENKSQQPSVSTKQGAEGSNIGDTDSKKQPSIAKGDHEYESQYSANNLENKSQQPSVSTKQGAQGSNIGDTDSKKQPSIAKGDHEYESQYSANNLENKSQQPSVSTKQGAEGSNIGDTDSKKQPSIAKGDNEYESQYSANNLENKSQQPSISTKQGVEGSNVGDTDSKKQPSIAKGDNENESQYSANNLENKSQQPSVSTKQGVEGSNVGDTDSKKQPSIAKGDNEYESQYSANNLENKSQQPSVSTKQGAGSNFGDTDSKKQTTFAEDDNLTEYESEYSAKNIDKVSQQHSVSTKQGADSYIGDTDSKKQTSIAKSGNDYESEYSANNLEKEPQQRSISTKQGTAGSNFGDTDSKKQNSTGEDKVAVRTSFTTIKTDDNTSHITEKSTDRQSLKVKIDVRDKDNEDDLDDFIASLILTSMDQTFTPSIGEDIPFDVMISNIMNSCVHNIEEQLRRILETFNSYNKDLHTLDKQLTSLEPELVARISAIGSEQVSHVIPLEQTVEEIPVEEPLAVAIVAGEGTGSAPPVEMQGDYAQPQHEYISCECCVVNEAGAAVPTLNEVSQHVSEVPVEHKVPAANIVSAEGHCTNVTTPAPVTFDIILTNEFTEQARAALLAKQLHQITPVDNVINTTREQLIRFAVNAPTSGTGTCISANQDVQNTTSIGCQCTAVSQTQFQIFVSCPEEEQVLPQKAEQVLPQKADGDKLKIDTNTAEEESCIIVCPVRKMKGSDDDITVNATSQKIGLMYEQDTEYTEPYIICINEESIVELDNTPVEDKGKPSKPPPKVPVVPSICGSKIELPWNSLTIEPVYIYSEEMMLVEDMEDDDGGHSCHCNDSESSLAQGTIGSAAKTEGSIARDTIGSISQKTDGSVAQGTTGSLSHKTDGSLSHKTDGSVAQGTTGSLSHKTDGSIAEGTTGSLSHKTDGSLSHKTDGSVAEGTTGSLSHKTDGSVAQGTTGSLSHKTDGSLSKKTDGSVAEGTTGSLSHKTDGSLSHKTGGSVAEGTTGSLSHKTDGSVAQETTGSISHKTDGSVAQETTGSISQKTDGSVAQDTTGSISHKTDGSVAQDTTGSISHKTDGSVAQETTGSISHKTDGSVPEKTSGSISQKTSGNISQKTDGSVAQETTGSISHKTDGSVPEKASGSISHKTDGSVAQETTGSVSHKTDGSVAQETTGSISQKTDGSVAEGTTGSLSHKTDGSVAQGTTGSLSHKTDGSISQKTDGSVPQKTSGSISNKTDGSVAQGTTGSLSHKTDGSISQKTDGSVPQKTSGSISHKTDGSISHKTEGSVGQDTVDEENITSILLNVVNDLKSEHGGSVGQRTEGSIKTVVFDEDKLSQNTSVSEKQSKTSSRSSKHSTTDENQDAQESIDEPPQEHPHPEHKPNPIRSPQKFVFDPNYERHNEPYLDCLYKHFPDDNVDGTCGSETEIPWDFITLPKNPIIRKPNKSIVSRNVPGNAIANVRNANPYMDDTPSGVGFEVKVSFAEVTSNIYRVTDGAACSQTTVSQCSAISDFRFIAKRCPKAYGLTLQINDGTPRLINSNDPQVVSCGSQKFTVTGQTYENISTITMELKPYTECGHTSEVTQVFDNKPSTEINVINMNGYAPVETKSCGANNVVTPYIAPANYPQSMPEIPSRSSVKSAGSKKSGGSKKVALSIQREEQEQSIKFDMKMTSHTSSTEQDKKKICQKSAVANHDSKDRVLAALDIYQAEMKPLRETLNKLKEKVRELNLPELTQSCFGEDPTPTNSNTFGSTNVRHRVAITQGPYAKTMVRMKPLFAQNIANQYGQQEYQQQQQSAGPSMYGMMEQRGGYYPPPPPMPYPTLPMGYPPQGMSPYYPPWSPQPQQQSPGGPLYSHTEHYNPGGSRKSRRKHRRREPSTSESETTESSDCTTNTCKYNNHPPDEQVVADTATGGRKTCKTKIPVRKKVGCADKDGFQTHFGPKELKEEDDEDPPPDRYVINHKYKIEIRADQEPKITKLVPSEDSSVVKCPDGCG